MEKPIHGIQVKYSTQTNVLKLFPASDMRTVLPNEVEDNMIEKDFDCPEFLGAPIRKGDVVGSVTLVIDGQRLGAVDLLAAEDVERDDTLYAIEKTKEFIFGPSFKWVLLGLWLGVVLFFSVKAPINKYRRGKRLARQKQVEEELARKELEASRRVYRGPMEPPDETDVKR